MMYRILLIGSISFCISFFAHAQRSEVGFGLGTFNYTGDLSHTYKLSNSKPAGIVFFRSNLSKVISFRAAITAGKIGASDKKADDAFAEQRKASFNLFLFEVSPTFEYHFLDWRDEKRPLRFTPYIFAGLALFGFSGDIDKTAEYSNVQGSIPFGVGAKYVLNPKWYLGAEFGMRKTFFDYLDNISSGRPPIKNYQYGNPNDNDNYFFIGLTLTRTFYDIPCPSNPYK
jgi:Domain of unknown function (DUF6089)